MTFPHLKYDTSCDGDKNKNEDQEPEMTPFSPGHAESCQALVKDLSRLLEAEKRKAEDALERELDAWGKEALKIYDELLARKERHKISL